MPTVILDVDGFYDDDLIGLAPGLYHIQIWAGGARGGTDSGGSAGSGGAGGNYAEGKYLAPSTFNLQVNVSGGTAGFNDVFSTGIAVVAGQAGTASGATPGDPTTDTDAGVAGSWLVSGTDVFRYGGYGSARSGTTPGAGGSGACPTAAGNNASGTTGGTSSGATSGAGGNAASVGSPYGGGGGGESVGGSTVLGGVGHVTITLLDDIEGDADCEAPSAECDSDGEVEAPSVEGDADCEAPTAECDADGEVDPPDIEGDGDCEAPSAECDSDGESDPPGIDGDGDAEAPSAVVESEGTVEPPPPPGGCIPQILPDGKVLVIDGKIMCECCCDPCDCEAEGASPVAGFSYDQTGYAPCKFDFENESVAGTCGAIVSYMWYRNSEATPFSTEQSPEGVEFSGPGPWYVTLVVTDDKGCDDSVFMEIVCTPADIPIDCCNSGECLCLERPDEIDVTFSGGTSCATDYNQTFRLQAITGITGPCQFTFQDCGPGPYVYDTPVSIHVSVGGRRVVVNLNFPANPFPATCAQNVRFEKEIIGDHPGLADVVGGNCDTLDVEDIPPVSYSISGVPFFCILGLSTLKARITAVP